jgi:hypothetical protein
MLWQLQQGAHSMSDVESTDQTESNEPLWQVQLASGQVCRMTLELLDDAFQDGLIKEDTLIRQDGTEEWVTLAQVAGLDSESDGPVTDPDAVPADAAAEIAAAASPIEAEAPMTIPAGTLEIPTVPASEPPAFVPATAASFAEQVPVAQPAPQPVLNQTAGYFDPFAPPVQVAQLVPPPAQAASFATQSQNMPNQAFVQQALVAPESFTRSTAPVAADIDFDVDTVNFGRKRSPAKWIVGIAAVLGGVGFAAMSMNSQAESIPPAVAAPAMPPPYETPPPSTPPASDMPATTPAKATLSDDARRALADADKARAAKMQQKQAQSRGAGATPAARPGKKSDPFHKGGDKFDPLNSSL